jgi:hypothetical protein
MASRRESQERTFIREDRVDAWRRGRHLAVERGVFC